MKNVKTGSGRILRKNSKKCKTKVTYPIFKWGGGTRKNLISHCYVYSYAQKKFYKVDLIKLEMKIMKKQVNRSLIAKKYLFKGLVFEIQTQNLGFIPDTKYVQIVKIDKKTKTAFAKPIFR